MNKRRESGARENGSAPAQNDAFGENVSWDFTGNFLVVAADRSLGGVLDLARERWADWIIVVRAMEESLDVFYYAFRYLELMRAADDNPERKSCAIEEGLCLQERMSSRTSRGGRAFGPLLEQKGVSAGRIIEFDAAGRISAIGQQRDKTLFEDKEAADNAVSDQPFDLGGTRGGEYRGVEANGAPSDEIEVTLSAETKSEIAVDEKEAVLFRIELSAEASPLGEKTETLVDAGRPITVSLSTENDAVRVIGNPIQTVDPPTQESPRNGFFQIEAMRPGTVKIAVTFRQGGTELGIIGLSLEVVSTEAGNARARSSVISASRDFSDDDKLVLLINEQREGNQIYYQYFLSSEALELPHVQLKSKTLLDRGDGPAASILAFVERIYESVTRELRSLDECERLSREARALGAKLCEELLDPEVAKLLWPLRDRIKIVELKTWEAYIPWELIRLKDPESEEIDERFLAEYGLVRMLTDEMPPKELALEKWGYMGATYPNDTFPPIGAELDYFTATSGDCLRKHGVVPMSIPANRDSFYDALARDELDVFHVACHAESKHQSIERANLIIGDEMAPGLSRPRPVKVETLLVEAETRMRQRRPLVFLNGCETGRIGPVLTAWGGWPNVFLRAGAGAFVGSAWPVRDTPAATFSQVFYDALMEGMHLFEAANRARAAAKKKGDLSWLAYKVYGHPKAKRKEN